MGSVMDACLAASSSPESAPARLLPVPMTAEAVPAPRTGSSTPSSAPLVWTPARAAGALGALIALQSLMIVARGRLLAIASERVAARLRRATFESLLTRHDLAFFDRNSSGELQSRLASDCTSLQKLVVADAIGALRATMMIGGSTVAMLSLSPQLFAVSVTTFPAAVVLARSMGERIRARQREVQDSLAQAGAEAERALGSIATVKLFAAEGEAIARYGERVDGAREQAEVVGATAALVEAGVGLSLQASMLAVLAIGGQQLIDGTLSHGEVRATTPCCTRTRRAALQPSDAARTCAPLACECSSLPM